MQSEYYLSFLVVGGVCLGFALHALSMAVQTRRLRYVYLLLLSLLEAGYCFAGWRYFTTTESDLALPWGQAFCAFTPYITWIFGELTMDLSEQRARWLRRMQRVNFALTTAFVGGVVIDMLARTSITMRPELLTDLESLHRHRFVFTPLGMAYLAWVAVSFSTFAVILMSRYRAVRDLLPMIIGSILYFVATISDFAICVGAYDAPFTQHIGFFALVIGCWRVISSRFEHTLAEMKQAVARLEEQRNALLLAAPLLHKQRLDSLGTLAAGVAHEINNPIHGIMNYALLLKRESSPDTQAAQFADEIALESKRIAEIVQRLLRFARPDEVTQSTVTFAARISDILDGATLLIRHSLVEHDITLDIHVPEGLPEVTCQAGQLQQVIMNLVANARDAIVSRCPAREDERRIRVEAFHELRDGESWWGVEVADTGDGFEPREAERMFDPFFTTKGTSGTGLGLSVSHGIVHAHGGSIRCSSEPGRGARFAFTIPCWSSAIPAPEHDDAAPATGGAAERPHLVSGAVRRASGRGAPTVRASRGQ